MSSWHFQCLTFVLSLISLCPSLISPCLADPLRQNEDLTRIALAIEDLATKVAHSCHSMSAADLHKFLTDVQEQTKCGCQQNETTAFNLAEVKRRVSLLEETIQGHKENARDRILALEAQLQKIRQCRPPFHMAGGDCIYIVRKHELNWNDARKYCKSRGGDLVVPSDVTYLLHYLAQSDEPGLWMGATDLMNNNEFLWLNGVKVNKGWGKGEPNNFKSNEHCLMYQEKTKLLNDYFCYRKLNFICSKA